MCIQHPPLLKLTLLLNKHIQKYQNDNNKKLQDSPHMDPFKLDEERSAINFVFTGLELIWKGFRHGRSLYHSPGKMESEKFQFYLTIWIILLLAVNYFYFKQRSQATGDSTNQYEARCHVTRLSKS